MRDTCHNIIPMQILDNVFKKCANRRVSRASGKQGRPPLQHMLILTSFTSLLSFLYDSFLLFLSGNARLHSFSDKVPHPPPNPIFQNSLHRQFMLIKYVVS